MTMTEEEKAELLALLDILESMKAGLPPAPPVDPNAPPFDPEEDKGYVPSTGDHAAEAWKKP